MIHSVWGKAALTLVLCGLLVMAAPVTPLAQTPQATTVPTATALPRIIDSTATFSLQLPEGWLARPEAGRIDFGTTLDALDFARLPEPGDIGGFVLVAPASQWAGLIESRTRAQAAADSTPEARTGSVISGTPDVPEITSLLILEALRVDFAGYYDRPDFAAPALLNLGEGAAAVMRGTARGGDVGLIVRQLDAAEPTFALIAFSAAPGELDLADPALRALARSVRLQARNTPR